MIELVMWDLDETLVATMHLRDARHGTKPCDLSQLASFVGTSLHAGVDEALRGIKGVRTGLVTSSPGWYADQLLDLLLPGIVFDAVVTHEDVATIKPDPEPLVLATTRLSIAPEHSVYVGDDQVDQAACAAAGVRFLGAGWAHQPTFSSGAETLAHPLDILDILDLR